ncbi:hypothetical protein EMN47_18550 [Prolixibacteraceae bacterium JC049]|nr:hypothetical protein [Prolixibacteraceae bacterium JC049]
MKGRVLFVLVAIATFFSCEHERKESAKFIRDSVAVKEFCFGESKFECEEKSIIIKEHENDPVIEQMSINGSDADHFFEFCHLGLEYAMLVRENKDFWPIKFTTVWNEEVMINCPENNDETTIKKTMTNGAGLTVTIKKKRDVFIEIKSKDEKSVLSYRFHFINRNE